MGNSANRGPAPTLSFAIPSGRPKVLGYVSQQFNIYRGEATMAFSSWIDKLPTAIKEGLLEPLSAHTDGRGGTLAEPAASSGAKVGDL